VEVPSAQEIKKIPKQKKKTPIVVQLKPNMYEKGSTVPPEKLVASYL
jgi:hypothetical protein